MPKKNNAGKCTGPNCCGTAGICWDCDVPLSISVSDSGLAPLSGGSGNDCCDSEIGTYVMPNSGITFVRCFPLYGPIINGNLLFGGGSPTCCPFSIVEPYAGASGTGVYPYACLIDYMTCVGSSQANHALIKTLLGNMLEVTYSGKTVTAILRHNYEWCASVRGLFNACGSERAYVNIVDTYSRTFDNCNEVDGAILNHVSRTRTNVDTPIFTQGTWGGTGDELIWGPSSDRRSYFVCPPKNLSLNMP